MKSQNVCFFIPKENHLDPIHTVHFVLETSPKVMQQQTFLSMYRMHLVVEGKGVLHLQNSNIPLQAGDIFFGLPSIPFHLSAEDNFKYIYVSYLGARANYLTDKFHINRKNCAFTGFQNLIEFWKNAINMSPEVSELRSESVLLYTFSSIATKYYATSEAKKEPTTANEIKKFIDKNFAMQNLSLKYISNALSYNPKYISTTFKAAFKSGISEYLSTVRIQYACTLLEKGVNSIQNVAFLCGFNDPLYFSKVFKAKTGLSPTAWLKNR